MRHARQRFVSPLAQGMDEVCLIRSMNSNDNEHYNATLAFTRFFFLFSARHWAWVSYGLGTVNQNLPSFIVLAPQMPYAGCRFSTMIFCGLSSRCARDTWEGADCQSSTANYSAELQQLELGLAGAFNRQHQLARANDPDLPARIQSFETAFSMQTEAQEVFDLTQESEETIACMD